MQLRSAFILLSFFIFLLSFSQAQTAKMSLDGKPRKSSTEFVGSNVRDANGRICAMLKVISDMDGFKYQANNGVVRVDDNPGEDLVYLQPDERVLQIYKSGYEPLQIILSEYGIQLHSKEVWQIKISGSAKTGDLLPVTVFVQPNDANITIDGKAVQNGKTVKLSKGQHRLRIKKEGFNTINKKITVSEQNVVFNYGLNEVDLQAVQIKTVPKSARIYLDNVEKGLTDDGFFIYPGQYQLKLSKSGYLEVNETITVTEGARNIFSYTLLKNSGILQLSVKPRGARIKLNQIDYSGKTTIELPPGKYELEISQSGYLPQKETIEIVRGKTLTRRYTLIKNSGTLILKMTPSDAKVLINKEDFSNRSQIELAPGRYKIEIYKDGWYGQSETVTIERGKTLNKIFTLRAKTGKLQFKVKPLTSKVTLKQNGRVVQSWTGMKYIKNLQVGSYELECRAEGYQPMTKQIVVKEKRTTSIDWTMKKGPARGQSVVMNGIEMVFVKGGTFEMGCTGEQSNCDDDEKPVHRVTVGDFYMGKYEVTQKQWKAVMGSNPSYFKGDNLPVESVSWNEVQKFIRKLNAQTPKGAGRGHFRLPTEAEWEYAARGGSAGSPTKYSGSNNVGSVAWYSSNSGSETHPVGQKQPNELGLYDMSGNVYEWCWDWYGSYSNSSQDNPRGPSSGSYRVYRGGGWSFNARSARVAYRYYNFPGNSSFNLGFRLVRIP